MRRLVGYDLNGWRDLAARNWLEQPDEDVAEGVEPIVSGGMGGVVVRLGDDGREGLMGGMQALRAPHGLGGGWGPIGAPERRVPVVDLLDMPGRHLDEIAAALRGMADPTGTGWMGPTTAVLAIPDIASLEESLEEEQEGLLQALRMIRATGDSLLVWRPVLACLAALDTGALDSVSQVGVVGHDTDGLTGQRLLLRRDRGFRAPERREIGQMHFWDGGLKCLRQRAWQALLSACETSDRAAHLASARALVPLALGETPGPEALRRDNGEWDVISPEPLPPALPPIPAELLAQLRDCEIVLVDTPMAGALRDALLAALSEAFSPPVRPLAHADVARGGLLAAGRIARGEPVYFDFLPQLSTIVQDAHGVRSFDLIPPDAVLPAGRVYRSKEPARLALSADTESVKVYLRKQHSDACRLAEVPLAAPPGRTAEVTLDVEQAPAAGRARLTLASDAFPAPLHVDWDRAEVLAESWEALIESLQRPRPTIPNRVVLPCGLDVWHGRNGRQGLETALLRSVERDHYDWNLLARLMSARSFGRYAISSDGDLPTELSAETEEALEVATEAAEAHILARLDGRVVDNNDSLRFLTWQFRRCPASVIPPLIEALNAPTGQHPFVWTGQNRKLVYQGLGRVVADERAQHAIFDHLLSFDLRNWNSNHISCAAHILSRTETGPQGLERPEIESLVEVVLNSNEAAIGTGYHQRFIYTPFLMVGLLRFRLVDPWALVVQQDPLADRLLESTQRVIADMARRFDADARVSRYREILEEACDWLRGEGRNPNILHVLAGLADGDNKQGARHVPNRDLNSIAPDRRETRRPVRRR